MDIKALKVVSCTLAGCRWLLLMGLLLAGCNSGSAATAAGTRVAGSLEDGKPVGLFFVTKSVLGNFRTMSYYFSPDGVAYENPVGLSAAELAAPPARSKGPYSVSGKTLSIAWTGYPQPESAEMLPLGGGFSWSGGSIFSAVGPFQNPDQLVGTFEGGTSTYASGPVRGIAHAHFQG